MGKHKAEKSLLPVRGPTIPKGYETYANPVGRPTLEVGKDVLYGALEANGHTYSVGDTVWMSLGKPRYNHNVKFGVAEIMYIWVDGGEKGGEGEPKIEIRWYKFCEELGNKLRKLLNESPLPDSIPKEHEVFETDEVTNANSAKDIVSPVDIVVSGEYGKGKLVCRFLHSENINRSGGGRMIAIDVSRSARSRRGLRYSAWNELVQSLYPDDEGRAHGSTTLNILPPSTDNAAASTTASYLEGEGGLAGMPGESRTRSSESSQDPFEVAISKLHVNRIPYSFPCRETELANIYSELCAAIHGEGNSNSIYISGQPGTGKTATVHAVISRMRHERIAGRLPPFTFVEINGARLQKPEDAYSTLWGSLSGEHVGSSKALQCLEQFFTKPRYRVSCNGSSSTNELEHILLLVDELDYMRTPSDHLLYNLFNWPMLTGSRFTVVGIANIVNLPEMADLNTSVQYPNASKPSKFEQKRLVDLTVTVTITSQMRSSIANRMGRANRFVFHTYNVQQVEMILNQRLKELPPVVRPEAVQMVAKKVSSTSGDVRTALGTCRRALEIAKDRGVARVEVVDVQNAAREADASALGIAIRQGTIAEKHIIAAVAFVANDKGAADRGVQLQDVASRAKRTTSRLAGMGDGLSLDEVQEVVGRLGANAILRVWRNKGETQCETRICLTVPATELQILLRGDRDAWITLPEELRAQSSTFQFPNQRAR